MSEQIERIMKALHCTEQEAQEIAEADKAIDKGEKMEFDLTPEQEKVAKKMRSTGTRKTKTVYNFEQRKRKENPTKRGFIASLAEWLTSNQYDNVRVSNAEREIDFTIDGNEFTLTLVQHRKPKT